MGYLAGKRVFVAGHRGMAGSAIVRELQRRQHADLVLRPRNELDLQDAAATLRFFEDVRPQVVYLAAAKVGGILANNTYPADFLLANLQIQLSVISAAHVTGVERLIFLGSSCIYPRDCPQPIREEYLLTGPLEPTNRPYALAKIAGVELCWSMNRQHGTKFLAAMPTNLYGPGDNYDLQTSHVLPALIRKMHEAKARDEAEVGVWGTGTPRREFLHSDDLAGALVFLGDLEEASFDRLVAPESCPLVNIGTGKDLSIAELAHLVAEVVGFQGRVAYDSSKPDGTPRKVLDISRLLALGWVPRIPLRNGLQRTYADYASH